jgi:hypothetical protein
MPRCPQRLTAGLFSCEQGSFAVTHRRRRRRHLLLILQLAEEVFGVHLRCSGEQLSDISMWYSDRAVRMWCSGEQLSDISMWYSGAQLSDVGMCGAGVK